MFQTITSRIGRRCSLASTNSSCVSQSEEEEIKWKKGNLLGQGAYGKVFFGLITTGELIAVKQFELDTDDDPEKAQTDYEKILEELNILRNLKHPNIVQ